MTSSLNSQKSWWKTFLTPGWVIAALLIVVFSYFAFTFLAPWQLGKNEALVERNEHLTEAFDHDPEPIATLLDANGTWDPTHEWARVTATGEYVQNADVLLRLRPVDRTPAFQVLTPFAIDGGPTILVNRGWVPAVNVTEVPEIAAPPAGTFTITGLLRADEGEHPTAPVNDQGYTMVHSISPTQVSSLIDTELAGTELAEPYLQLLSGEPGVLTAIPLPVLETGNHLSYGLQWIAFGIMAPAGLIYFIWAETRERRRFKEEQEQLAMDADAGADTAHGADSEVTTASNSVASKTEHRMRSRYGNSRHNYWAKAYEKEEER